jgi:hypothetical protein
MKKLTLVSGTAKMASQRCSQDEPESTKVRLP